VIGHSRAAIIAGAELDLAGRFYRACKGRGRIVARHLREAGMIRFKPIVLTAAAVMIGAGVILSDPIFQGPAISLLFGSAVSSLLTVLVIPAIHVVLRDDGRPLTKEIA
jgi:multidrug efflux pump subunit AcrB